MYQLIEHQGTQLKEKGFQSTLAAATTEARRLAEQISPEGYIEIRKLLGMGFYDYIDGIVGTQQPVLF